MLTVRVIRWCIVTLVGMIRSIVIRERRFWVDRLVERLMKAQEIFIEQYPQKNMMTFLLQEDSGEDQRDFHMKQSSLEMNLMKFWNWLTSQL